MELCYDIAQDLNVTGYKYNDPIFGEMRFDGYHDFYEYSLIDVDENHRFRSIGIPFKVFGDHTVTKLGTLKIKWN